MFRMPPQRDDFRNFLLSEQCAEMAQLVANLATWDYDLD